MCTAKARVRTSGGTDSGSILGAETIHLSYICPAATKSGGSEYRMRLTAEVAVVGGGPAGLTTAIALALARVETTLPAKGATPAAYTATFLLASSVTALDTLGAWARGHEHAAPLRVMRMIDDTARLLRAPEVAFAASEIGLDAFGHNIENRILLAALKARASELAALAAI